MWQSANEELERYIYKKQGQKIQSDRFNQSLLLLVGVVLILVFMGMHYRERKAELIELIDDYMGYSAYLKYSSAVTKPEFVEARQKRLQTKRMQYEEVQMKLESLKDYYQISNILIIVAFVLLVSLMMRRRKGKENRNLGKITFCIGTCVERECLIESSENRHRSDCFLSIQLEDGSLLKRISVDLAEIEQIGLGQKVLLVRNNGVANCFQMVFRYDMMERKVNQMR